MKTVIDRCQLLWYEAKRGDYPAKNQAGIAFLTAGSVYPDMFRGTIAVLRHLMNSLEGHLYEDLSILCPALDSAQGKEDLSRLIDEKNFLSAAAREILLHADKK